MEEVDLEYIKTSNSNLISKIKSIDDILLNDKQNNIIQTQILDLELSVLDDIL